MKIEMCNGKTTIIDGNNTIVINGENFNIETEGEITEIKSNSISYVRCGEHSTFIRLYINNTKPPYKYQTATIPKLNSDALSDCIKESMRKTLGW